jgi:SPW repeat-containing protein
MDGPNLPRHVLQRIERRWAAVLSQQAALRPARELSVSQKRSSIAQGAGPNERPLGIEPASGPVASKIAHEPVVASWNAARANTTSAARMLQRAFVPGKEDVMNQWSNEKFCDVANLILGVALFFSPWIFEFAAGPQTDNAWVSGIAIGILSIAALAAFAVWEEWLNLVAGLWVIVSPWVLKFQGTTAMTVHVVIGILVAALAAIELWLRYQNPPRLTARR